MDVPGTGLGALEVFEGTAEAFDAAVELFNGTVRIFAAAGSETALELFSAFHFAGVGGTTYSSPLSATWDLWWWALFNVDICSISYLRPWYLTAIFKLVLYTLLKGFMRCSFTRCCARYGPR